MRARRDPANSIESSAPMPHPIVKTDPRQSVVEVPGARLYYEIRGQGPLIVLLGAPMDAAAFAPLAEALATDHTVMTCDPRGIHRSTVNDPDADSTPEDRATDVAHLLEAVNAGAAAVFGSSGGAVSALVLVQQRPDLVTTLIAHEPPLDELLPNRDAQRAVTQDVCMTYLSGDILGGWRKFLSQAGIAMPVETLEQFFGPDRDPQTLADERYWFAHELRPSTWWHPNFEVLRNSTTQIIVGIGEDSAGQACDHTARALAAELRLDPTLFVGGHTGFIAEPHRFANTLRAVLAETTPLNQREQH